MAFKWRKPLLLTYYDNYRYGTSLYSTTAEEIEKKYRDTLSRTYLRSDRADLGLSTFTGSQLHGGVPGATADSTPATSSSAASKDVTKSSGPNLYAPISLGYGRSYYDTLRGSSEPKTTKKSKGIKKSSSYHSSSGDTTSKDTKSTDTTVSKTTKFSPDYDFLSKTLTSTATTESREIQSHLDHVNRWVGDAESKIKNDLVGARNKMQTELGEVSTLIEDTTKYNEELQRVIKRQARQISDLHSQHDDINRHLVDVNENLERSRMRCQGLQSELANVQSVLETASKRRQ